jgi:hypothetical protein
MTTRQKNEHGGKSAANSPTRAAKVSKTRRTNGSTKLNEELANMILESDEPATTLAPLLGVDVSTVTLVRRGKTWKNYSSHFAGLGARA